MDVFGIDLSPGMIEVARTGPRRAPARGRLHDGPRPR
ncbi:hypothetical protein [Streptomyces sp. Pv4-95]